MGERNERLRWQLVSGWLHYLHLDRWAERYNRRAVLAGFGLLNAGLSIVLVSLVALMTQEPFIFPSLGATAFILFHVPLAESASPRNTFCGHLTGAAVGLLSLYFFGLYDQAPVYLSGLDTARVGAAALSLGLTGCLMVLLRVVHPPAGATALIVSLGLMPDPGQLPALMAGVALLLAQAFLMNRLAGIPYPVWSAKKAASLNRIASY
ncbi:MAG: HPP family protein [Natronospirillum sp.]